MYKEVPQKIDFPAIEKDVQHFWNENKIFEKLVAKNRGSGKKFRFIDGPITANNPMGVHHAWGRTLKDVFHRYKAMHGCDARYQNGFDCQGLWVEVEVEKELGFKSKKDIESFGIDNFVNKCKDRVKTYALRQTEQSKRLGYWMDWDNSYYTMAPENNYTIWHFLKKCHEKGWLRRGTDVMPWCQRCGTAMSDMEMSEGYKDLVHRAVFLKLPIKGRSNEYLLVWTTTPWTLTSNTAVAVNPELQYLKVRQGEHILYVVQGRKEILKGEYEVLEQLSGDALVGLEYHGPFDELTAQKDVLHRVVPWKEVSESDGTGMVHIAPGCGKEDFLLGKEQGLAVVAPLDESGHYVQGFDWLTGKHVSEVAKPIFKNLEEKGMLYYTHDYKHRYPTCWRDGTELVYRLVGEWFISMDELRPKLMEVTRTAKWIPEFGEEREIDWLRNMGDWCISKKRFWGLALPIFVCPDCGEFDVVGGYEELKERAVEGWDKFEGNTPHRPWIDAVKIGCRKCGGKAERVKDVANPWLDAGIVPYSTLIPNEECYTPLKAESGAYKFDPKRVYPYRKDVWEEWFPAEFITECFPGQFRNWFYAILTMSTVLEGRTPFETLLGHALVKDEKGEDMHKSKGNSIPFDEAADQLGADLMRWIYCSQNPSANLLFGFNAANEYRRRLLTLHNVYAFFVTYARLDEFSPVGKTIDVKAYPLFDRWILAELNALVKSVDESLGRYDTTTVARRVDAFVDTLSTWYVRRSRRRFWKSDDVADKNMAYMTLYTCLETLIRLMAPLMPFWTEHMYQNLVRSANPNAPESIHLNPFPQPNPAWDDEKLIADMDLVRTLVSLGHAARKESKIKVRQPLAAMRFKGATPEQWAVVQAFDDVIKDEINVKSIVHDPSIPDLVTYTAKPQFGALGPKFGPSAQKIAQGISALTSEQARAFLESGSFPLSFEGRVVDLAVGDATITMTSKPGTVVRNERDLWVSLDTQLTDELIDEGNARELVHKLQNMRKDAGFDVADRIVVQLQGEAAIARAFERHRDYIATETLAVELVLREPAGCDRIEEDKINGHQVKVGVTRRA